MGNCFACFREPHLVALEKSTICKEGMGTVELQSALPINSTNTSRGVNLGLISNGNHLQIHHLDHQSALSHGCTTSATSTSNVSRNLYSSYQQQKRQQTKSSVPLIMGMSESKSNLDSKLSQLFDNYKDSEEECILAEGIEQLCRDLQLSPDEFKVLILAWKLNAEQMCRFTRSEFMNGLKKMRVDTIKGIQMRLPEYAKEVSNDADLFKDLYRFTFKFGLDSGSGQRILPSEIAVSLWKLVFTVREPPILQRWLRFLEKHPSIRGIPRDTWNMFLNFSETVSDDLSTYDDNEAWPSLFDDFVEYENDQTNQNIVALFDKELFEERLIKKHVE